jgi:hypothetical protein
MAVTAILTITTWSFTSNAQSLKTRIGNQKIKVMDSIGNRAFGKITPANHAARENEGLDIMSIVVDSLRAISRSTTDTPTLQIVTTKDSTTTHSIYLNGDSVKVRIGNASSYYGRIFQGGFEMMNGINHRADIGYGGSGNYGIIGLQYGNSYNNRNWIVPSPASHTINPYYDTLPTGSGTLVLTGQLLDTGSILVLSDTNSFIRTIAASNTANALNIKYVDTNRATGLMSSRYLLDSIRTSWMWKNTPNTFSDTPRLVSTGSRPILIGNNGWRYISIDTGTGYVAQAPTAGSTLMDLRNQAGASLWRVVPGTIFLSAATINVTGSITSTQGITSSASVQGSSIIASNGASTLTRNTSTRGCPLIVNQNNTGANAGKNFSLQEGGIDVDTAYRGIITAKGIAGGFGTPTISDSSGVGGTTVSLVAGSTDVFGTAIITLTNPVTNGSLARITFLQVSATTPQGITITAVNDAATGVKIIPIRSLWSTTGFTLRGVGLVNPGTYELTYIIGKLP